MDDIRTKKTVREAYSSIATQGKSCCGGSAGDLIDFAKVLGYSDEELATLPEGANLGLSCGNPTALASLKEGEVVVDLGSGAGFDCFVAAPKVGATGKVIGVDMTPAMVEKARENAKKGGFSNVEFRLGEIENLPVADNAVDAVISNCVINLSVDKARVFDEVRRVLKPGGRIAVSDMALTRDLPGRVKQNAEAYVGCIAGAVTLDEYRGLVEKAGFREITVIAAGKSACADPGTKDPIGKEFLKWLGEGESLNDYAVSVYVEARK
ncbi:MAG TPA: arsenite methyltransferase [Syntrophorhabdaceae bacterium]|jgi:SAM-dependent methyltransferase